MFIPERPSKTRILDPDGSPAKASLHDGVGGGGMSRSVEAAVFGTNRRQGSGGAGYGGDSVAPAKKKHHLDLDFDDPPAPVKRGRGGLIFALGAVLMVGVVVGLIVL